MDCALREAIAASPKPLSKPALIFLIALGNAAGAVFAGERSAWLGITAALLFSTLLISWRATVRTLLVLLVVASALWATVPMVQKRLLPLFHWQTDISLHVRLNLWKEALHLFLNKPLFGIGIRNFPHHVIPEALGQGHAALDHAHSNYMHILATTGLVGACAYIYLWISVILTALANCKDAGHALTVNNKSWSVESGINFGILAGVIALLVSGIFEYNFNTAQIRLAQWFFLAMLWKLKPSSSMPSTDGKLP